MISAKTCGLAALALGLGLLTGLPVALAGGDLTNRPTYNSDMEGQYTALTRQGSVLNTRHNMMQNTLQPKTATPGGGGQLGNIGGALMDESRNNYGEVCVYCHTPHSANANTGAPLWNRNIVATTYLTYDTLGTTSINQSYRQPGTASLACLSCHDGLQAVDAIINMPGFGGYNATPTDFSADGELSTRWIAQGGWLTVASDHRTLSTSGGNTCLSCHSPGGVTLAVDFTVAAIGTDLRNDHPVGVTFPATSGAGTDWKTPTGIVAVGGWTTRFFDENGNARLDKGEIRLYDSGNGPSVECASCHDPHGVPSAGPGSRFNPTFLRKSNQNSAVCLTCHSK
jgi:putative hemolysin